MASLDNRIGEAEILTPQSRALVSLGRHAEAREPLARAAQLWKELDDPRFEKVTAELAAIEQAG